MTRPKMSKNTIRLTESFFENDITSQLLFTRVGKTRKISRKCLRINRNLKLNKY